MLSNHAFVSMERKILFLPQPSFNHSVLLLYAAPSTHHKPSCHPKQQLQDFIILETAPE